MTGEKLFLRYAFPCVEVRESMGVISPHHNKELTDWIKNAVQPARSRLKFCFPNAFRALRALASNTGREIWSIENIQDYWHNNHRRPGECGVHLITVGSVDGGIVISNRQFFVNIYNLSLRAGDRIYTHKKYVIEKVD